MALGISPGQTVQAGDATSTQGVVGQIPGKDWVTCTTTTGNFYFFGGAGAPCRLRIINFCGRMLAGGGAGDTFRLYNAGNAVSNAIDVSALADHQLFNCNTLDNSYDVVERGDQVYVTTTSGATAYMEIEFQVVGA